MYHSTLINLQAVIDNKYFFNIPIYQRLYVWGSDQIKILLDDLIAASIAKKDVFYLGGTLVIEQSMIDKNYKLFDLIDGQQRFTTLWLISVACERLAQDRQKGEKNYLTDYRFSDIDEKREPRIRFAIRPEVSRYFDDLLAEKKLDEEPKAASLSNAISVIIGYFNDNKDVSISDLSKFILEKVKLILTFVPKNTDLNKLFEVINNRGVQLQHHEILKARLLAMVVNKEEREVYSQMWDACSYMNDYIEKNIRATTPIKISSLFDNDSSKEDTEKLASAQSVKNSLLKLHKKSDELTLDLKNILKEPNVIEEYNSDSNKNIEEYESDRVRSIITFPMLLQHTLRIFLMKHSRQDIDKILDKDLLYIFNRFWLSSEVSEKEIKSFIELLWTVRYLFDKYIIKWVEDEKDEIHSIRRLRLNKNSVVRESIDAMPEFAMLQSMLYHSQQLTTHYWLTPLLNYLRKSGGKNAHDYLKYLDNYLLCSVTDLPLIQRTLSFVKDPWFSGYELQQPESFLNTNLGTQFAHYWFYKLEYILWEKHRDNKGVAWQAFKMTAKNSVEHVSPQNPESYDSNVVSKDVLNSFGNLALVSRSINSEYSNKPYLEKRAHFLEKNSLRIDSLKLDMIYKYKSWNDALAKKHLQMIEKEFVDYFKKINSFSPKRKRIKIIRKRIV